MNFITTRPCVKCEHFKYIIENNIPTQICKLFKYKCPISKVTKYEYPYTARLMESKCGIKGRYFISKK